MFSQEEVGAWLRKLPVLEFTNSTSDSGLEGEYSNLFTLSLSHGLLWIFLLGRLTSFSPISLLAHGPLLKIEVPGSRIQQPTEGLVSRSSHRAEGQGRGDKMKPLLTTYLLVVDCFQLPFPRSPCLVGLPSVSHESFSIKLFLRWERVESILRGKEWTRSDCFDY